MNYVKFLGKWRENNLIKTILCSFQFSYTENFPLVKVVGRRERLHPDIDILCIKDRKKGEIQAKLVGYETKVITPDGKGNIKWGDLYAGIGEAFFYLQFGLNQCGLILGFHKDLNDSKIEEFVKNLEEKKEFLNYAFQKHSGYFNLSIILDEGKILEIIKAEMDFSTYFHNPPETKMKKKMKKFRKLFVEKEFKWNNKLASKCKFAVIK